MLVVTVMPLSKSAHKETLTYFSTKQVQVGDLVEVEIRKKKVDALIMHVENANDMKSEIKDANFSLKKIGRVKGESFFRKELRTMAESCADYFLTTTGAVLERIASEALFEHQQIFKKVRPAEKDTRVVHQKILFQAPIEERLSRYRSLIRESFAKKKSILLILPTHNDIEDFYEHLKKGIEPYTWILHSSLRKNAYTKALNQIVTEEHPLLIIGTAQAISVPRHDLGMIIVEKEASGAYKTFGSPTIDLRICAEVFSYHSEIPIILADTLLRNETAYRRTQPGVEELAPLSYRINNTDRIITIKNATTEEKKFTPITNELREKIKHSLARGGHVILFVLRKGYSPLTVCNDCGETLECIRCSTPLVFYKDNETRSFQCHTCGRKESASLVCPHCGGWNLIGLGIGSEQVADLAKEYFPESEVVLMDRDTVKSDTEARRAIEAFYKAQKGILVMTELGLHYARESVDMSAIVSIESLFSIPSFRSEERAAQLIMHLIEHTRGEVIIQTRHEKRRLLESFTQGTLLPMHRTELVERKEFGYPPYTTLIKLTATGGEDRAREAIDLIGHMLAPWNPEVYPAFIRKVAGHYRYHLLLKIPRKDWGLKELDETSSIDRDLAGRLRAQGPQIKKVVDPEDIL